MKTALRSIMWLDHVNPPFFSLLDLIWHSTHIFGTSAQRQMLTWRADNSAWMRRSILHRGGLIISECSGRERWYGLLSSIPGSARQTNAHTHHPSLLRISGNIDSKPATGRQKDNFTFFNTRCVEEEGIICY